MNQIRTFKMRNQVVLLIILFIVAIEVVFCILIYANVTLLTSMFSKSFLEMSISTTSKSIQTFSNFYQRSTELLFARDYWRLSQFQTLYYFILENQNSIEPPLDCNNLRDKSMCINSVWDFTYEEIITLPNDLRIRKKLEQVTSLLNMFVLVNDNDFEVLFTSIAEDQYFSIYPGVDFTGYIPHERPWYLNHLKEIKNQNPSYEAYFSSPYQHHFYNYTAISYTMSINNLQQTLEGVVASELNFSYIYHKDISTEYNINIMAVDTNGQILISPYDQNVFYLNQTNRTGISASDSYSLLQNQSNLMNNCIIDNYNCFINQTTNSSIVTLTKAIGNTQFVQILFLDSVLIQSLLRQYQSFLESSIYYLITDNITLQIYILISTLVFIMITVYIITKPLVEIIEYTKNILYQSQINRPRNIVNLTKIHDHSISTIKNLAYSLSYLKKCCGLQISRKGQICKEIEWLKYPRRIFMLFNYHQFREYRINRYKMIDLKGCLIDNRMQCFAYENVMKYLFLIRNT